MRSFKLSRRAVLRGTGGISIALPWMEVMGVRKASAQTSAARFLAVYTPGGTVMDKWRVSGTESAFALSPILKPMEGVKSKLLVLEGVDMQSAIGEQHQSGIVAWLSGTPQSGANRGYAAGPSIDQVIAKKISATKRKRSLQIALRWATGKSHGLLSPINACNFEDNGKFNPIPPSLDPRAIWNDLFGALDPLAIGGPKARLARRKSVLDFVDRRYAALAKELGTQDRQKLEQHLDKVRELEKGVETLSMKMGATCAAPMLTDTKGYNPSTGLSSSDNGGNKDISTDSAIPKVGKLFMDMMVMALACDVTAVGTLQWSDTEAKHTFPWLGLNEHHHFYQHDGGFRPAECEKIGNWYAQQHAYLLDAMDKVDMGGHSLLDESVVFFGSELSNPPIHNKQNMPFLLAGKGGGLRPGRYLKYASTSHNNLLVSILNLFGDPRKVFGDPRFCKGPLTNLT
jgi:hypothetical protein